jgi:chromosome segregation ATPase
MPTSASKVDIPSTSIKGSKPSSFETSDHTPIIEKLQQENAQLLQQLEERKTMDRHLHHDNAVLQEKVNSLQRLVDQMTTTNRSLQMQLKHRKRPKTKSSGQEGEASKANPPPPSQV